MRLPGLRGPQVCNLPASGHMSWGQPAYVFDTGPNCCRDSMGNCTEGILRVHVGWGKPALPVALYFPHKKGSILLGFSASLPASVPQRATFAATPCFASRGINAYSVLRLRGLGPLFPRW